MFIIYSHLTLLSLSLQSTPNYTHHQSTYQSVFNLTALPATGPHEYTNEVLQSQKFMRLILGTLAPMLPGECVGQTTHPSWIGGACNNFDGI